MQRDAALGEGDITLCREGVSCGTERRRPRHALAHANAAREEARVVASAALKHAAHARGHRRICGERGARDGRRVARAEERVQVGAGESREPRSAVRGDRFGYCVGGSGGGGVLQGRRGWGL